MFKSKSLFLQAKSQFHKIVDSYYQNLTLLTHFKTITG